MKKRYSHRGHSIECRDDIYTSLVGGRTVSGSMLGIRQCIDWWCDTRIFRRPAEFERQTFGTPQAHSAETYRGIQIMSDEKQPGLWYILVRGQLLKGPLPKIKQYIDTHSLSR
ncbi:DUF3319 domain-containing protein [Enterovibrio norvegicus FF-33]|uniref:DUF3319 domain-containing protein n=1 Tax=Enterovibrio norvegicus FF-454 TaxID=1185651 RepID=A0A1E5CC24_9GAMM|nr:DUF3319 domain-containing protein [Enterovibrio norvegicus]OEE63005.1 DUF3319 domain-containing protein [Enterovibrio norvegicus FF-454]OEE66928.1 DUF3319 domain-containing protein [Enterovibrio norvegicus FF-33]OEE88924.1 DUF3319 domain-containing protein [Enterovibrio norvegicus FF-162]